MRPGALDEEVSIVEVVRTPDGGGGFSSADSVIDTVFAHIEPVRGQERAIADQLKGVTGYRVTGRNLGAWATITTNHKLSWRGHVLNVRSVPQVGRAQYLSIEAEAGVVSA